MPLYFDITPADIAQLDDSELRELVGKLCEADYRKNKLPVRGIIWGGNQDAPDGGFDVLVDDDDTPPPVGSFVLNRYTAFQVKRPSMSASTIKKEMAPQGKLRPALRELVARKGAYIIVSSGDSCPKETGLKSRLDAMRSVLEEKYGSPLPSGVRIDFLDRDRLATWTRQHPGLMLWVLQKVGRAVHGWKPYQNWSHAPGGIEEEYLLDEELRLKSDFQNAPNHPSGYKIADGIDYLREALAPLGSSVRLIGLSGVGKTRLTQALFDDRIGQKPLDPTCVFYTDVADDPDPSPKQFAEQLIAQGYGGVLIVDNCSSALHASLTKTCQQNPHQLSVLTIEYDVREQISEESHVFRLEPTGQELIEKLLKKQFPTLGNTNATKIAECAGGNFRVAISLAKTVKHGESVATLKDDVLFARLFQQSHSDQPDLLESAEVLSLLYSFDGEDVSPESELQFLADLVETSPLKLYKDTERIAQRDLIQKRGKWRAVLPHAIANNLAKRAITQIPPSLLTDAIFNHGTERIIQSFSRKIGSLHDSEQVVAIVEPLFSEDGWLGADLLSLSSLKLSVFKNLAPVSPETTLSALERAFSNLPTNEKESTPFPHQRDFAKTLCHIAYEDRFFDRAVRLLVQMTPKKAKVNNDVNSPIKLLMGLFRIALSGSHASIDTRCQMLRSMADSTDSSQKKLAETLLNASLTTGSIMGMFDYQFGARSRDYGFRPQSFEEQTRWYTEFLKIATDWALLPNEEGKSARIVIANNFRGLWTCGLQQELETIAHKLHAVSPWTEGWAAVKTTLQYEGENLTADDLEKLQSLGEKLKPRSLEEKIDIYILSEGRISFLPEFDDPDISATDDPYSELEKMAEFLGELAGKDSSYILSIAAQLFDGHKSYIENFGVGLAHSQGDLSELWNILRDAYHAAPENGKYASVQSGMMRGLCDSDPELYLELLDRCEKDNQLSLYLISFLSYGGYNRQKLQRLHQLLDEDSLSIWVFKHLAYGRKHETICDCDLVTLLKKIFAKPDGDLVVLEILKMRFLNHQKQPPQSKEILDFCFIFLNTFNVTRDIDYNSCIDHDLSTIVEVALADQQQESKALTLSQRLADTEGSSRYYPNDYSYTLEVIAKIHPMAYLNGWFDQTSVEQDERFFRESSDGDSHKLIFETIAQKILFSWADQDPTTRYLKLASAISLFEKEDDKAIAWKEIALKLIDNAPTSDDIMKEYVRRFSPSCWSGSRVAIVAPKVALLQQLATHGVTPKALEDETTRIELWMQEAQLDDPFTNRSKYQSFE